MLNIINIIESSKIGLLSNINRDEFGEGPTQKSWSFTSPTSNVLLYFYERILRNFQNLEFFVWNFFLEKLPKISNKISETFSKLKKVVIFVPKLVRDHYVDKNVTMFPIKLQKTTELSLKPSIFQNFGRFRCQKFGDLCYKKPIFLI